MESISRAEGDQHGIYDCTGQRLRLDVAPCEPADIFSVVKPVVLEAIVLV
jgi:hypothetical protein